MDSELASLSVHVDGEGNTGRRTFRIRGVYGDARQGEERDYRIVANDQHAYLDLFASLARDFGTRMPRNRMARSAPRFEARYRPLLTSNIAPGIRYGYGDPAVCREPIAQAGGSGAWHLVVTSNDAPDSFPILCSDDLQHWSHAGYVFPARRKPAWCLDGEHVSDFWAPELHFVHGRYLLCFCARERDRSLAIGLATAPGPAGPFTAEAAPLLRGGVIDPHIFVDRDGDPILFWKDDSNARWPRLFAELLQKDQTCVPALFPAGEDQRTALLIAALWPWARGIQPMEQFFLLQPLIEAVVDRFPDVRRQLAAMGYPEIAAAMRTPIFAQRLSSRSLELLGSPTVVLENDLAWEGHLIEGPWLYEHQGRFYLFYAGNDFSTDDYGIGVAVADAPFGPYRKIAEPLLRSTASWAGPGHPSVVTDSAGQPRIFFHAFFPGRAAYKEFRALLNAQLMISGETVELLDER